MRTSLLLVALATGLAVPGAAQSMADFSTARQLHGESRLAARLDYAAGSLKVGPAETGVLYRMRLRYDQERFTPVGRYSASDGQVTLGTTPTGDAGIRVSSKEHLAQLADVTLSPEVEVGLNAVLGAVEGDLELGGLRLHDLNLQTGASRTTVRFSKPNRVRCGRAEFGAGAAELSIYGLGNSRCSEIRYEGGVGKVTLDFSGDWTANARATITVAMCELTLRLPKNVGVRLTVDRFLSSVGTAGLVRDGDAWVTRGYAQADRKLDLSLSTAIGGVKIEWVN